MTEHEQPAGWYPSPDPALRDRFARYWDGNAWTDHQIEIATAVNQPAREEAPPATSQAPAPATASKQPNSRPTPSGTPRRFAWIPKLVMVLAVILMIAIFGFENADANGPIGYSLTNESTAVNPLVNAPELRVSTSDQSQKLRMTARQQGALTRFPGMTWSLDEPVTIEVIPAYPGEAGHTFVVDLRRGGANALNADWFLRIDVVATDRFFEIEVNQPITQGFIRSRQVTQRITLPRSNERMLRAALDADRERNAAARREVQAAREECIRDETEILEEPLAPILILEFAYQTALERRRIYGTESLSFDEYRRRITNLVSDMRSHLFAAERARADGPLQEVEELGQLVAAYSGLREAWTEFEVALRRPLQGPGRTFGDLYPREWSAVERGEQQVLQAARTATGATARAIRGEVAPLCEMRYPMPSELR